MFYSFVWILLSKTMFSLILISFIFYLVVFILCDETNYDENRNWNGKSLYEALMFRLHWENCVNFKIFHGSHDHDREYQIFLLFFINFNFYCFLDNLFTFVNHPLNKPKTLFILLIIYHCHNYFTQPYILKCYWDFATIILI